MQIDKDTLKKIAHLARLEFDESKVDELKEDLEGILSWVEHLNELDTENVEPLVNMSYELNALREDVAKVSLSQERGFSQAPSTQGDYFKVPKVIE